jgi:hypothetical protein
MAPSGIEPATFRPLAKCLNQLRHQQRALPWVKSVYCMSLTDKNIFNFSNSKVNICLINFGTAKLRRFAKLSPVLLYRTPTGLSIIEKIVSHYTAYNEVRVLLR